MSASPPPSRIGPWHVLEELGRGEFSSVHRGYLESDPSKTEWALKLAPLVEACTDKRKKETKPQTSCRLLFWENQVYKNYATGHALFPSQPLRHSLVDADGYRLLAIELQRGGTLKHRVLASSRPSVSTVASVGLGLLAGLRKLHLDAWFVYKDIKPENVMLRRLAKGDGEEEEVVLVDFGLAERFVDPKRQHFAAGGASVGTPLFMSRGVHSCAPSSRRDDLESVGYLLWWMLAGGRLPWQDDKSERDILQRKTSTPAPAPLLAYFAHVTALKVEDVPDYGLLERELEKAGGTAKLVWREEKGTAAAKPAGKVKQAKVVAVAEEEEEVAASPPPKPKMRRKASAAAAAVLPPPTPTRTQPPRLVKRRQPPPSA